MSHPAATGTQRTPYTPAWLISAIVFAAALWTLVWFTAQAAAPAILGSAPVEELQGRVRLVTTLMVLCSFVAGLAGGLVGGWQGWRAKPGARRYVLVSALSGPLLVAVGLVLAAWVQHEATPVRSTILNLALVGAGAAMGGMTLIRLRGSGSGSARLSPTPVLLSVLVLMLAGLMCASPATRAQGAAYEDIRPSGCTLAAQGGSFSASLSVLSIDLGSSFKLQKQQTADGRWGVSVTYGAKGGFKLMIGEKLGLGGANLSAETAGHLTLDTVNQYSTGSEVDADRIIRWAVGPYLAGVAALPGIGPLVHPALSRDIIPDGFSPPAPTSTQYKLGGTTELALEVGPRSFRTKVQLGSAIRVQLANAHNTDDELVSDPDEISVGVDLDALGSGALDGTALDLTGQGQLTLRLHRKSVAAFESWLPRSLSFAATAKATAAGGLERDLLRSMRGKHASAGAQRKLRKSFLKKLNLGLKTSSGVAITLEESVNLEKHPDTLVTLVDYVRAIARAFSGRPVNDARVKRAADKLATSFSNNADVGITGLQVTDVRGDFAIAMGRGITFGTELQLGGTEQKLRAALYRLAPKTLAVSNSCSPRGSA